MCHSILVTYIVYHTRNEVVSIMIVCMKGQKSDFMSNSSGTCDRIPFICIRRSFGATTTETTGTASAVHRNRLDGFLEPLNKSRPSLRAD